MANAVFRESGLQQRECILGGNGKYKMDALLMRSHCVLHVSADFRQSQHIFYAPLIQAIEIQDAHNVVYTIFYDSLQTKSALYRFSCSCACACILPIVASTAILRKIQFKPFLPEIDG